MVGRTLFVKLFGTDNEDIKKLKDRNPNKRNRKKFSNEQIAEIMAERTHSTVVRVIGKKIILYRKAKRNPKINLPK